MTLLLIVLLFRWTQQAILFISECFVLVEKLCLSKYFWTPVRGGALHKIEAIPVLLMCRVKMGNWHCGIVQIIIDLTLNTAEPVGLCGKYKLDLQNNSCAGNSIPGFRWAVRFLLLFTIFLFLFEAPWLTGQIVAMECAVGQKKRRCRNPVTSWRGLTLFLPPLTLFVHSHSLFLSSSSIQSLCFFIRSESLSLSLRLPCFDAGPGTLAWPFLFLYIFLARNNIGLLHPHTLTQTYTLTNRNVWESPSGYLCNLHLKLVRGKGANRPRRVHANGRNRLAAWLRSKILST